MGARGRARVPPAPVGRRLRDVPPTFLYESLWNAALVVLLVRLDRRRVLPRGALILVYAVGYGLGRFLVELLRIDTVERYGGLSRNNWLALLLILVGVGGCCACAREPPATGPTTPPATGLTTGPTGGALRPSRRRGRTPNVGASPSEKGQR
jgi:hypothetical protein